MCECVRVSTGVCGTYRGNGSSSEAAGGEHQCCAEECSTTAGQLGAEQTGGDTDKVEYAQQTGETPMVNTPHVH